METTAEDQLGVRLIFFPKKKNVEHYAGFNRRMWAATVDSLLLVLLTPVLNLFSLGMPDRKPFDLIDTQQKMAEQTNGAHALGVFWQAMVDVGAVDSWLANTGIQTVLLCVLTAACWKYWSATPGKMLLKIKIVDAVTEAPITNRQIILRLLGYVVSTLPLLLGFIWIGLDKRKQGWHDKIAGTVVVIKSKRD